MGRERGKSLKRLHRPNRLRVWLHEFKGESGFQYLYGFGPVYLNEGLMKPRRGLTLAADEEKLGVGKLPTFIDKRLVLGYLYRAP